MPQGSGQGQFNQPHGICFDRKGRIYATEGESNHISVFEPDGTFAHHITGTCTSIEGNQASPWRVAFDHTDVTNYNSSQIFTFTPDGKSIKE